MPCGYHPIGQTYRFPRPDVVTLKGSVPRETPINAMQSSTAATGQVGFTRGASFGAGQLTISVFFQVTSLLLLPFMTNVLAVPAAIAGLVIMIPKVAAVFLDPAVGFASSRVPERWKPRRPLLLAGGVLTALSFPLLFHPAPIPDPVVTGVAMFVAFLVANVALSCLTVSYLASAVDIAERPEERTTLMSWRVSFHMSGVLLGGLAPAAVAVLGGGRMAYTLMAVGLGLACLVAVAVNYSSILRTGRAPARIGTTRIADLWEALRRPSAFRDLATIYGIKYFSNGLQYAANAYFVLFVIRGDLKLLSALVVTMTLGALASQPVWVMLAARIGKLRTFAIATVGIGLAFLSFGALGPGDRAAAFVISAVQGIFAGGGALMSWSLFVDSMQLYGRETGVHRPELLSGVWSAIEKSTFAIGVFVFGAVLEILGLVPSRSLDVVQPDSALLGVRLGMALLPALGMLVTLIMILQWLPRRGVGARIEA